MNAHTMTNATTQMHAREVAITTVFADGRARGDVTFVRIDRDGTCNHIMRVDDHRWESVLVEVDLVLMKGWQLDDFGRRVDA